MPYPLIAHLYGLKNDCDCESSNITLDVRIWVNLLHHKRTVILIESYRSFSLPKKPLFGRFLRVDKEKQATTERFDSGSHV